MKLAGRIALITGAGSGLGREIALQCPIGRLGTPQEVAAVALYLASDDSNYTVGQVISPNGGYYM